MWVVRECTTFTCTGASSDLENATKIARLMVTKLGMTEAVSLCVVYTYVLDSVKWGLE